MDPKNTHDNKIAVFFLTDKITSAIQARFNRIQHDVSDFADCFFAKQTEGDDFGRTLDVRSLYSFNRENLPSQLGYPFLDDGHIVPGCSHYPLTLFSRSHHYDYYWLVEYDVEFSGDWSNIIALPMRETFAFAASHFRSYSEDPNWYWWHSFQFPILDRMRVDYIKYLWTSFNPIFCVSSKALKWIDFSQRMGCRGHNEVLLINLIKRRFWKTVDLFERGYISKSGLTPDLPLETLSTLRWRPSISADEYKDRLQPNMLYHPIKDDLPQ